MVWSLRVWGRVEKRWQCQDMATGDRRVALAMEAQTSRVSHGPRGSAVFCPLPLPGEEGLTGPTASQVNVRPVRVGHIPGTQQTVLL